MIFWNFCYKIGLPFFYFTRAGFFACLDAHKYLNFLLATGFSTDIEKLQLLTLYSLLKILEEDGKERRKDLCDTKQAAQE